MAVSTNDLPDEVQELEGFAKKVLGCLVSSGGTIATAESCTGGLLASLLTDLEGFGSVFDRGFVTYAEKAKVEMLGVPATMIAQRGVVSSAVARAMAEGALHRSSATIAIGITGFAGPAGPRDEEGLVHIAAIDRQSMVILRECHFGRAGRDRVRMRTARAALEMIGEMLERRQAQG